MIKEKIEYSLPPEGHRQRVINRYIKGGLDVFTDVEIIELLLYYVFPRQDTAELAYRIFKEFGSLHALFEATPKQIMVRTGISEKASVLLSMISQLTLRYQFDKWGKKITFTNSRQLASYAIIPFKNRTDECFYVMCLDSSYTLRSFEQLEFGTIDRVEVHPRAIINYALINKASYVVLAHNHPSGSREISRADISSTMSIMQQLKPFNIGILDHIIAVGNDYVSFAEEGMRDFTTLESINNGSKDERQSSKGIIAANTLKKGKKKSSDSK